MLESLSESGTSTLKMLQQDWSVEDLVSEALRRHRPSTALKKMAFTYRAAGLYDGSGKWIATASVDVQILGCVAERMADQDMLVVVPEYGLDRIVQETDVRQPWGARFPLSIDEIAAGDGLSPRKIDLDRLARHATILARRRLIVAVGDANGGITPLFFRDLEPRTTFVTRTEFAAILRA